MQVLLGVTVMFLCATQAQEHSLLEKLRNLGWEMILEAAVAQSIETPEALGTWIFQQRLNDPEYFLPRLNQRLEEIVGDGWLFDRSQV